MWPAERFAELFHRLAAGPLPGAVALILAGPGKMEQEMAAPLARLLPDAIDTTGQLALPEVTACLRRCALYVGNDSGLMHLAAAAGTPTVGLCGATRDRAAQFVPAGRRARWAMGSGERMEDLTVETALEAALDMLSDLPEPG
jgi:ADP-heptose:LPS heptosyltransferase